MAIKIIEPPSSDVYLTAEEHSRLWHRWEMQNENSTAPCKSFEEYVKRQKHPFVIVVADKLC